MHVNTALGACAPVSAGLKAPPPRVRFARLLDRSFCNASLLRTARFDET
jgi:hypothetical protein